MSRTSLRPWIIGLALIFMCAIILVVGTSMMYMHPDESLVFDFTRKDLSYLVRYLAQQDSHPPLWFSSFWLWRQFVGDSEFAGRLLAAFYSLIALALVYQIGRRWFGAPRFGLIAIALLGVNTFFFNYALEIRPYGLIMLLGTASMWTYQRWLTRRTGRSAMWYALTLGVMLYVHYFMVVLMIVQALYFLLLRPSWKFLKQGFGVVTMAVLIWLPWLPFAIFQVLHVRQAETIGGNERGLLGAGSTTEPTSLEAVLHVTRLATNGQILLYVVLLLIGAWVLWRKANWRLAAAWALAVPTTSLLINLVVAIFLPRYVIYLVIGLALAAGAGLAVLPGRIRLPAVAAVLVIGFLTLPNEMPVRVPYRDMYREVSAAAQPGDVIFFDNGDLSDTFVGVQMQRYLDPNLLKRRVESIDDAIASRRVWYVTDEGWWTEAARARFSQVEHTHPLQQVIGSCDREWCYLLQLLEAPPNPQPTMFGDALAFRGIDQEVVASGALSLRLWWTAEQPPPQDYSIGLHVLDASGILVAQSDGPLNDYYSGQPVQTSQMEPDKIYIDQRHINLPADLPPGSYQLELVVYQSWDNQRLILPDGSDRLLLNTAS